MTAPDYAAVAPDFSNVRRDIHRHYGAKFDAATIDTILDTTIEERLENAKIRAFLPALVEREVGEKLSAMLQERGESAAPRKEVLFVCNHNAGRSQIAASIMAHNVNRDILFRTVGLQADGQNANTETGQHAFAVYPTVVEALEEKGFPTNVFYQKHLEPRTVHRADVIVLMGVDELPSVPGARVVKWDIADPKDQPLERVREIRDEIEAKIQDLINELV